MSGTPKTFGISNLLAEGSEILYCSLFSTENWGRVGDLLVARLGNSGIDEFGFRLSMLGAVFEAFRGQGAASEPILLECGLDANHVAIGVSFTAASDPEISLKLFGHFSRRILFREHPTDGRRELVILLGVSGEALLTAEPPSMERVTVEEEGLRPASAIYLELGDLDYSKLLADSPLTREDKPSTGEYFSVGNVTERFGQGAPSPSEGELAESLRKVLASSEDGAFERIVESYSADSGKRSGNWTDAMFAALLAEKNRLLHLLHQMAEVARQKHLESDLIQAKLRNEQIHHENKRLEKEVLELKHAVSVIRQSSAARDVGALAGKSEMAFLQGKFDRAQRQVEDFKKMNKQLVDRLSLFEKKKNPDAPKVEEVRARLEKTTRVAQERKDEADGLRLKLDEAEHETDRLKAEMARLETRLKTRSAA